MPSPARRRTLVVVLLLLLLALVAFLLSRCQQAEVASSPPPAVAESVVPAAPPSAPVGQRENPGGERPKEVLGDATLTFAPTVLAGADFSIQWTGPGNSEDYITLVKPDAPAQAYDNYTMTARGNPATLTSPVEAGRYEVRYVTGQTKTILARAPIEVTAAAATLKAPASALIGSQIPVEWTGPDHKGDYVTIVAAGTEDGRSGNYTYTERGSPLEVKAPVQDGPAELRYQTGQDNKVLARRPILLTVPSITLEAPAEIVEGGLVSVTWSGPANRGDYLTVVPKSLPDGRYGNNDDVSRGSPLRVQAPMGAGPGEIRYMTGQGARVLARREITFLPAMVTLEAVEAADAGSTVEIAWTGPNNRGDYLTIVPAGAPDAQVGKYANAESGSPSKIAMPPEKGPAEIRYVSGQGRIILGRRPIQSR
jgi:Ca-activated chloride channel family protein